MSGAILETYLMAEILKSYWNRGMTGNFYFYRDRDQKEIDLIISQDGRLYPVEFKKTMTPSLGAAKNFAALKALTQPVGEGGVVCLKDTEYPAIEVSLGHPGRIHLTPESVIYGERG